jgi:methyl-accepting chemotaxis protein
MIGLGWVAIQNLMKVQQSFSHVVDVNMESLKFINESRNAQRDLVIISSNIASSNQVMEDAPKLKEDFEKSKKKYLESTRAYQQIPSAEGEEALRKAVDEGWAKFIEPASKLVELSGESSEQALASRSTIAKKELNAGRKAFRESFKALTDFHDSEAKKWTADAKRVAKSADQILWAAIILGSLIALLLGFLTASQSEKLTRTINEIAKKIANASDAAIGVSQKVSAASEQLASGSAQQAASIQETAATMEQINAMVTTNADNAERTVSVSNESYSRANFGRDSVLKLSNSIKTISESNHLIANRVETTNKEMGVILEVISEIDSKTKVINDIVFQTKLLAFNASVEAARAGENGKGFSVVAEEVGNLARMSGVAAKNISEILEQGVSRVNEIIKTSKSQMESLMKENQGIVGAGVVMAKDCEQILEKLVEEVSMVNQMASNIAGATREQAHGVSQVNAAVTQIDRAVQESSGTSHELSQASRTLSDQTQELNGSIRHLLQVVNGNASKAA